MSEAMIVGAVYGPLKVLMDAGHSFQEASSVVVYAVVAGRYGRDQAKAELGLSDSTDARYHAVAKEFLAVDPKGAYRAVIEAEKARVHEKRRKAAEARWARQKAAQGLSDDSVPATI